MQTLFLFVVLFCSIPVRAQNDLISDPGFTTIADDQCASSWWFRSDFSWNETSQFPNPQCQVNLELPTIAVPGVTKGNTTDINHYLLPQLPMVTGGDPEWPASAAAVDMNTPCRAALWQTVNVANNSAMLDLSFQLWVQAPPVVQSFIGGSFVPNATELQYLMEPYGLLQQDTVNFPFPSDVVNMLRVDLITADSTGSFYNNAFSLDPSVIAASFPLMNFGSDSAIPSTGTGGAWMTVTGNTTLPKHGDYALRFASAQSVIGTAWAVSDVHLIESGGTVPPPNITVYALPWDLLVDNAAQTVGGTLTISKTVAAARRKHIF